MELEIKISPRSDCDGIAEYIVQLSKLCDVSVAFDPWGETHFIQSLLKRGFPKKEITERRETLSSYLAQLAGKLKGRSITKLALANAGITVSSSKRGLFTVAR